jgi:uncharacterized protein YbjQ (UPF0145 family)
MADVILATAETIARHHVVRTLGYVEGYGRKPQQAVRQLLEEARRAGADAVVGVRWSEMSYVTAWLWVRFSYRMYGTAVAIEPEVG